MTRVQVGRIRRRATFRALARSACRARSGPIRVSYAQVVDPEIDPPAASVAYVVGRRIGGAVVRNRLRRRLRAGISELRADLAPGAYLVQAEPPVLSMNHAELVRCLQPALQGAARPRLG